MDNLIKKFSFPKEKPKVPEFQHGWTLSGNKRLLAKYIKELKPKVVLELGVWLGGSTRHMLQQNNNVKVICVDHWKVGDTISNAITDEKKRSREDDIIVEIIKKDELYETFLVNCWEYKDRIIPMKMGGHEAIRYLAKNNVKIDMIYLDMDHEFKPVKEDLAEIQKYFPNIVTLGDDIRWHDGVGLALMHHVKKHPNTELRFDKNCYAITPLTKQPIELQVLELDFAFRPIKKKNKSKLAIVTYGNPKTILSWAYKLGVSYKIFVIDDKNSDIGVLMNHGYIVAKNNGFERIMFVSPSITFDKQRIQEIAECDEDIAFFGFRNSFQDFDLYTSELCLLIKKDFFKSIDGFSLRNPKNRLCTIVNLKLRAYKKPMYYTIKGEVRQPMIKLNPKHKKGFSIIRKLADDNKNAFLKQVKGLSIMKQKKILQKMIGDNIYVENVFLK